MHPVLGTMMPEICQVPHLPDILPIHHRAPDLMIGDAFITFTLTIILVKQRHFIAIVLFIDQFSPQLWPGR
ncbi:hypothetical protein EJO61_22150 [Escherichia coli]|nr:hypothetical protein [Escherichia coli]